LQGAAQLNLSLKPLREKLPRTTIVSIARRLKSFHSRIESLGSANEIKHLVPFSFFYFLSNREKCREFHRIELFSPVLKANTQVNPAAYSRIP